MCPARSLSVPTAPPGRPGRAIRRSGDLSRATLILSAVVLLTLLLAVFVPAASAQEMDHSAHMAHAKEAAAEGTKKVRGLSVADVELVTHEGREVRFYSDLVEDRVVAMNFVFTSCTTICPPMGAIFGKLQNELGDRLGEDVHLISISIDPSTDTPERLTEWAAKFGRRDGWTLVTGDKATVDTLLKSLQVFAPDFEDHAPVVLLGDDAHDRWNRTYGLAPPARLAELIEELSEGEGVER